MIMFDDTHGIDSDGNQITLYEVKVKQEGKSVGDEYLTALGYYSSVQDALRGYARIKGLLAVQTSQTLKELSDSLKKLDDHLVALAKGQL